MTQENPLARLQGILKLKLITEFDSVRNEMFFAKKILLVEGPTEKYSLPYAFKLMNIDINEKGISIIDSASKNNLPFIIKILKAFKIPFVVLHDEDRNAKDYTTLHQKLNTEIENAVGNKNLVFRMDPDFEGIFNIKYQKRKVLAARKLLSSFKNKEQIPQIIMTAIERLLYL